MGKKKVEVGQEDRTLLENVKEEYLIAKKNLEDAKDNKAKEEAEKKVKENREKVRSALIEYSAKHSKKIRQLRQKISEMRREAGSEFAGKNIRNFEQKMLKEKEKVSQRISELEKAGGDYEKTINLYKDKLSFYNKNLEMIATINEKQKEIDEYEKEHRVFFERCRNVTDNKNLRFLDNMYVSKEEREERRNSKVKEEKENKEEKQQKEEKKEEKENKENKENKEEAKKEEKAKEEMPLQYIEEDSGQIAMPLDDLLKDGPIVPGKEKEEKQNAINMGHLIDDTDDEPAKRVDIPENVSNEQTKKETTPGKEFYDAIEPYYNEVLTFKEYMNLDPIRKKRYMITMNEEQSNKLFETATEGFENGSIREEEIINFSRCVNVFKKTYLAKAELAEDNLIRNSYKKLTGFNEKKINRKLYGLKRTFLPNKKFFKGLTATNEIIYDVKERRLDLENPADIKLLECDLKAKYGELYESLVNDVYKQGLDIDNPGIRDTMEAKFLKGYTMYMDSLTFLKKFDDIEEKFQKSGLTEKACQEFRMKHVFKGNYQSSEEFLNVNKLLPLKPKFSDRLKSKMPFIKYTDKTPDHRFKNTISEYIQKVKDRNNLYKDKSIITDLKTHVRSEEEIIKNMSEREKMQELDKNVDLEKENDIER